MDGLPFLHVPSGPLSYSFSCDHTIPTMHLSTQIRETDTLCAACGDFIRKNALEGAPRCSECDRSIHRHCSKKLNLPPQFTCTNIDRRIVPVKLGGTKVRDIEPIAPLVIPGNARCLICGEPNEADSTECSYQCGFKCHADCLKAHKIVKELLVPGSSVHDWNCDYISFWIGRVAVDDILADDDLDKDRVKQLIDLNHIEKVKQHRDSRKRRYDVGADDLICDRCGQLVPVEQKDHLWSHCTGIDAPPLSNDVFESVPNIKRRCLKIVRSVASQNIPDFTPITYRDALVNSVTVGPTRVRTEQRTSFGMESNDQPFVDENSFRSTAANNSTVHEGAVSKRRKRNRCNQLNPEQRQVEKHHSTTLSNRFSELLTLPDSNTSTTSSVEETVTMAQ